MTSNISIFEYNQDYINYLNLWEEDYGYLEPGYLILINFLKYLGLNFVDGFKILSLLPLLIILYCLIKYKLKFYQVFLIILSILPVYFLGPIRQSLSNAIILLIFLNLVKWKKFFYFLSLTFHWASIITILPIMLGSKIGIKAKVTAIASFIALATFYLVSNPWTESRVIIFFDAESYFSATSILYKLSLLFLFNASIKNQNKNDIDTLVPYILIISIIIILMGIFGLGENIIQRFGMSLDPFLIYAVARICTLEVKWRRLKLNYIIDPLILIKAVFVNIPLVSFLIS